MYAILNVTIRSSFDKLQSVARGELLFSSKGGYISHVAILEHVSLSMMSVIEITSPNHKSMFAFCVYMTSVNINVLDYIAMIHIFAIWNCNILRRP